MPVIGQLPSDPSYDCMMAGELMRNQAIQLPILESAGLQEVLVSTDFSPMTLIAANQLFIPRQADFSFTVEARVQEFANVRANYSICTPCGAVIPVPLGKATGLQTFQQSTSRWVLPLKTKTSAGVNLESTRVMVMDVGQLAVGAPAIQAEAITDVNGDATVEVPLNTKYLVVAYKPNQGGTSTQELTPTQV